jgi:hypothetical protein
MKGTTMFSKTECAKHYIKMCRETYPTRDLMDYAVEKELDESIAIVTQASKQHKNESKVSLMKQKIRQAFDIGDSNYLFQDILKMRKSKKKELYLKLYNEEAERISYGRNTTRCK